MSDDRRRDHDRDRRERNPRGPRDRGRRDDRGGRSGGPPRDRPIFEEPRWDERPDWGGVARRGAARVDPERRIRADRRLAERRDLDRIRPEDERPEPGPEAEPEAEEWILEHVEEAAPRRGRRIAGNGRTDTSTPDPTSIDVAAVRFGDDIAPRRAERLRERLGEAAVAYARDRYGDALALLRPIAEEAPGVAEVRELSGLAYYRQGRWNEALRELRAFNEISGSTEQHPVLADCARALGNHGQAEAYWDALRRTAPDEQVVAEGRIVMAGSLADRGRLSEAIALLDEALVGVTAPERRHLRIGYVRADLRERAGDLPAARSDFAWVQRHDPDFGDVAERLAALR